MSRPLQFIVQLLISLGLLFLLLWFAFWVFMAPHPSTAFEVSWKLTGLLGSIVLFIFIMMGLWIED